MGKFNWAVAGIISSTSIPALTGIPCCVKAFAGLHIDSVVLFRSQTAVIEGP